MRSSAAANSIVCQCQYPLSHKLFQYVEIHLFRYQISVFVTQNNCVCSVSSTKSCLGTIYDLPTWPMSACHPEENETKSRQLSFGGFLLPALSGFVGILFETFRERNMTASVWASFHPPTHPPTFLKSEDKSVWTRANFLSILSLTHASW